VAASPPPPPPQTPADFVPIAIVVASVVAAVLACCVIWMFGRPIQPYDCDEEPEKNTAEHREWQRECERRRRGVQEFAVPRPTVFASDKTGPTFASSAGRSGLRLGLGIGGERPRRQAEQQSLLMR